MRTSRLVVPVLVLALTAVACGDDEKASDTTAAATTATPTTIAAPENPDPVKVELSAGVMTIEQGVLAAGVINFEATNIEESPHVFAVARGESYEALPQRSNGAVDVDALGADFLGDTGLLMPGLGPTKVLTLELTPGTYILYCNGGDDPEKGEVSHISEGEYVVITVV